MRILCTYCIYKVAIQIVSGSMKIYIEIHSHNHFCNVALYNK